MQIDWFTFGAQIVNFLVLVWLLKRFLYGPIVDAMTERENRISDRFAEAREERETAEAEAAEYRRKQEQLADVREEKLAAAEEAANERRREMIEEARAEVGRLEQQWTDALRRERDAFLEDLAERASRKTVELAQRALRDLADVDLERQVIRVFVDRLRSLDPDQRQELVDAIRSADGEIAVHSVFELDSAQRTDLVEVLEDLGEMDVLAEFERDADAGFGIELRAGGHKIAWSLESYIAEMEEDIRTRIDAEISAGPPSSDEEVAAGVAETASRKSGTDQS